MALTITNSTNTLTFTVGRAGADGADGADGAGIAAGGTTGQVLAKASNTDYDTTWTSAGAGDLLAANNLSDLANAATARTNLGLGTAATSATGDFATAAQGTLAASATQPGDNVSTLTNDSGFISSVEGTAVLSTGEAGGTKFLREDGDGTCSWQAIPGGGDALTTNPLSQFASTTSAQLAGVISDETGTGALVFASSPTLVTPALGTPSALVLTNATGLPEAQVTAHQAALSITESQISDLGAYITGITGEPLSDLSDVTITTIASGEILKWNGTGWVNNTLAEAGIATSAQGALADSALQSADIDTLAELNSIITDATLIDTNDSRLSDSRPCDGTFDNATTAKTALSLQNVENTALSTWAGSTAITTLGTIATGTWQGTAIGDTYISSASTWNAKIANVSEDTTPQLGGSLDVNGNKIVSTANGNIDIEPNGTGNVLLGNFTFDADQTVGAGQDNYVLTYDNGTGLISLEAAAGGGGGNWTDVSTNAVELRDGTTATAAYVYNTYTDASNYERGYLKWDTNIFKIGFEALGTGSNRVVQIDAPNGLDVFDDGTKILQIKQNSSVGVGAAAPNSNQVNIGRAGSVSNNDSHNVGDAGVSNAGGISLGRYSLSNREAQVGFPRTFSGLRANHGFIPAKATTTNTSATEFVGWYIDGRPFPIPTDKTLAFSGLVVAQKSDQTENSGWKIEGLIKNDSGTTTLIASSVTEIGSDNASAWTVALSADDTNDCLKMEITAEATVYASASLHFIEQASSTYTS